MINNLITVIAKEDERLDYTEESIFKDLSILLSDFNNTLDTPNNRNNIKCCVYAYCSKLESKIEISIDADKIWKLVYIS